MFTLHESTMNLFHRLKPFVAHNVFRSSGSTIIQKRFLYEQTKSGSMTFERKKIEKRHETSEIERFKKSVERFKGEVKWNWKNIKDRTFLAYTSDNKRFGFDDKEVIKFWDFNQANNDKISSFRLAYKNDKYNDMNNWYTTCDSDYDVGLYPRFSFSTCTWKTSPSGHALFSGYLDKTVPKDGKVIRSGYAYLGSYKSRRPFFIQDTHHDFEDFTHIVLRVRGDGRRYFIVFDTSDLMDITWFDRYQYMLFTHGGPYWQYVKIPLTRFYFHYQGFVQDVQYNLEPRLIRNVGFLAYDTFPGKFSLEIDYVGFMHDSEFNDIIEYEGYYHESSIMKSYV